MARCTCGFENCDRDDGGTATWQERYDRNKPVMGSQDDTELGHGAPAVGARLACAREAFDSYNQGRIREYEFLKLLREALF